MTGTTWDSDPIDGYDSPNDFLLVVRHASYANGSVEFQRVGYGRSV